MAAFMPKRTFVSPFEDLKEFLGTIRSNSDARKWAGSTLVERKALFEDGGLEYGVDFRGGALVQGDFGR